MILKSSCGGSGISGLAFAFLNFEFSIILPLEVQTLVRRQWVSGRNKNFNYYANYEESGFSLEPGEIILLGPEVDSI